jgi:hypothetical protein
LPELAGGADAEASRESWACVMSAVTAATSAAGTTTVNPYWAGWPGGGGGPSPETGETAVEVIVTGVPIGR